MKTVLKFLVVTVLTIFIDDAYFEYCVSRPMALYLSIPATVLAIAANIVFLIYVVRTLKTSLKL